MRGFGNTLVLCVALAMTSCATSDTGNGSGDSHVVEDLAVSDDLAPPADLATPDLAGCGSCDDNVACTVDRCPGGATQCVHEIDHARCGDGELCTTTGCVKADTTKVCMACSVDGDCSADEVCGPLLIGDGGVGPADGGTGRFCLPACAAGGGCPKGFDCDLTGAQPRCVPTEGSCCLDVDHDRHGVGAGCAGSDCDDGDPAIYPGHAEVCDGKDNDCNGQTDEGFLCAAPSCAAVSGSSGFAGTPTAECKLGACTAPSAVGCGRYTCMPVTLPQAGAACRISCSGTDDTACVSDSYCDGAACVSRLPDGSACGRDRVCLSGHCQNGFCCQSGDCCATASGCPDSYAKAAVCDAPQTACQGHRVDKTCIQSQCGSTNVPDDSACGTSISISCGSYPQQACSGTADQAPLACPTSCTSDRDCVASAYCMNGTCAPRVSDGGSCTGSNQCLVGRNCLNGHCCSATTGACCLVPNDCPSSYAQAASCDAPLNQCQGHRVDKTCVASVCGSQNVPDDSACGSSITLDCSAQGYPTQACTGGLSQSPLACPSTCTKDGDCLSSAWCMGAPSGTCVARQPAGGSCTASNQCQVGLNCLNGFCCNAASGACCSTAANCPAGYASPAVCDSPNTSCQGHRVDKSCVNSVCGSVNTPDDTACGGGITITCGLYPSQACNGGLNQAPLSCPTSCVSDGNCAATAYCAGGVCVARQPDGGTCSAGNQCLQGRSCLNGHCCSASTGACCGVATDCPSSYGAAAVCDSPLTSCQGHRVDKTCTNFICGSSTVGDDTACSSGITQSCGTYLPVACNGAATQAPLSCPTSCTGDAQCVQPANHCYQGKCVAWVDNGGACSAAGQCRSGNCVNGTCCNTGCNSTACDSCTTGTCNPFNDPWEYGNQCLSALPDLGSDEFTRTIQAYIQSTSDTEDWYQMNLTDHSQFTCSGKITVTINGPAGTDYDVYLRYAGTGGACDGSIIASAVKTTYPDSLSWSENCGGDDSGWYFIQVVKYSGSSCGSPYTLTIDAHL